VRVKIYPDAVEPLRDLYASEIRSVAELDFIESLLYHVANGYDFTINVSEGDLVIGAGSKVQWK